MACTRPYFRYALDARDLLVVDSTFHDPKAFSSFQERLAALRFAPRHSVATHLLATLDVDAESEEAPGPAPTDAIPDPLPHLEPVENLATREG